MSGKLDRKGRETIREETRKEGEESAEEDSCNEKEGPKEEGKHCRKREEGKADVQGEKEEVE